MKSIQGRLEGGGIELSTCLIPGCGYRYLTRTAETTVASLIRIIERDRTYQDIDGDRFTLNGKPTDVEHDLARSEKTEISPEGRQAMTAYDPATCQAERVSLPELYDTTYDRYADGVSNR